MCSVSLITEGAYVAHKVCVDNQGKGYISWSGDCNEGQVWSLDLSTLTNPNFVDGDIVFVEFDVADGLQAVTSTQFA